MSHPDEAIDHNVPANSTCFEKSLSEALSTCLNQFFTSEVKKLEEALVGMDYEKFIADIEGVAVDQEPDMSVIKDARTSENGKNMFKARTNMLEAGGAESDAAIWHVFVAMLADPLRR